MSSTFRGTLHLDGMSLLEISNITGNYQRECARADNVADIFQVTSERPSAKVILFCRGNT